MSERTDIISRGIQNSGLTRNEYDSAARNRWKERQLEQAVNEAAGTSTSSDGKALVSDRVTLLASAIASGRKSTNRSEYLQSLRIGNKNEGQLRSGLSRNQYDSAVRSRYSQRQQAENALREWNAGLQENIRNFQAAVPGTLSARAAQSAQNNIAGLRLDAVIKDIDSKQGKIAELKSTAQNLRTAAGNYSAPGWSSESAAQSRTRADELEAQAKELQHELREYPQQYQQALQLRKWDLLRNNIDFDKYSAMGAAIQNPSFEDVQSGKDHAANIVTFTRDNRGPIALANIGSAAGSRVGNVLYIYMTDDEVSIYNYLLARDGEAKAQEYLDFLAPQLKARLGGEIGESVSSMEPGVGKAILSGTIATASGIDRWGSGLKQLFTSEAQPANAIQYASRGVRNELGKVSGVIYDLIETAANNAPSILLSMATSGIAGALGAGTTAAATAGQIIGAGSMGLSAAGNAYAEKIQEGYDESSARKYAALIGASESGLQYLLGGISKLGGKLSGAVLGEKIARLDNAFMRVALQTGASMLSEGTEEGLQSVLEPVLGSIVFDEKYTPAQFEEVAYGFLLGALSAGLMDAGNIISSDRQIRQAGSAAIQLGNDTIDSIIQSGLQGSAEIRRAAERLQAARDSGQEINAYQLGRIYAEASGIAPAPTTSQNSPENAAENVSVGEATLELMGFGKRDTAQNNADTDITGGHSVGAAAANTFGANLDYQDWADTVPQSQRYDVSRQQAENVQRQQGRDAINMPKRSPFNNPISKTAQTLINSGVTPEGLSESIKSAVVNGEFDYKKLTDAESSANAETIIKREGWDTAYGIYKKAVETGRVSKDMNTLGIMLYRNAATAGDYYAAIEIASLLAKGARSGAQATQAMGILNKLTPDGRLYAALRGIESIQDEVNRKYKDRKIDVKVNEQLAKEYHEALKSGDKQRIDKAWKAVAKEVAHQIPSNWADKINNWRYMAMLLNPKTHIRNIVGNTVSSAMVLSKGISGAAIERIALGKAGEGSGRTKSLLGLGKNDMALIRAAAQDYENAAGSIMASGKIESQFGDIEKYRRIYGKTPLEAVRRFGSEALDMEDMVFSRAHYVMSLAGYLKANGISAESFSNGTAPAKTVNAARDYAIREAQKATFRDINQFSKWVSQLGKSRQSTTTAKVANAAMSALLPFRKTPANIAVRAVEYSPIELAKVLAYDMYQVKHGKMAASEMIDHLASGLTGTAIVGLGAFLRYMGIADGGDDKDKAQADFNDLRGRQNYAINIGNKSYTLDWATPAAIPFFAGVGLYDALEKNDEPGNAFSKALSALGTIAAPMLELSMLSSVNDFLDEFSYMSEGEDPFQVAVRSIVSNFLSQMVPTIFSQIERTNETQREQTFIDRDSFLSSDTQYTLGSIMNKLPGEYNQIPYIDAWGRTEENGPWYERAASNFLLPWYTSEDRSTPVDDELQRLYDLGFQGVLPTEREAKQSDKVDKQYMTSDEYIAYKTAKGQKALEYITDLQNREDYQNMPDEQKAELITKLYDRAADFAREEVRSMRGTTKEVSAGEQMRRELSTYDYIDYLLINGAISDLRDDGGATQENADVVKALLGDYDSMSESAQKAIDEIDMFNKLYAANDQGQDILQALLFGRILGNSGDKYEDLNGNGKYDKEDKKEYFLQAGGSVSDFNTLWGIWYPSGS